jgi:Ca-activated chloride channel homolog
LTTAYKYGDPDKRLNVVILSDGITEQKERALLIDMIGRRPSHARVFCIGVGNEINRPLLEQMAEDSGGLAAFISVGDDFTRQAKAFRRKLMHPAAGNLKLAFEGIDVHDLAPARLPSLYFGAPVRVYGRRYRGTGDARVTLTGQVQGRDIAKTVSLGFPSQDAGNPEIERMWAQKRISQLLKAADRQDNRQAVADEVVRLGETFSIVTEYTSFLVLENDAEYQRWKIQRRNLQRLQRDRNTQAKRQQTLEALRQKAMQGLGPQPLLAEPAPHIAPTAQSAPLSKSATPQPGPHASPAPVASRRQSRNFNLDFGSGPVGPLFIGVAMLIRRRKKRY